MQSISVFLDIPDFRLKMLIPAQLKGRARDLYFSRSSLG